MASAISTPPTAVARAASSSTPESPISSFKVSPRRAPVPGRRGDARPFELTV